MATSFVQQVNNAVKQLDAMDRATLPAIKRATVRYAEDVQAEARRVYGPKTGRLYRTRVQGDEVRLEWRIKYIPWFLEHGTRRHEAYPRAVRRAKLRGGDQKRRRVSQKTLDREASKFGERRGKFAMTTPRGLRASASPGGIRAKWTVRKSLTRRFDNFCKDVRKAILDDARRR